MKPILHCLFLLTMAAAVSAAEPERRLSLDFDGRGVTIRDVRPGSRIAWLAMIREPGHHYTNVRIVRGFGPAGANSTFTIARDAANESRAIWVVADVDGGVGVQMPSPALGRSPRSIVVHATPGDSSVVLESTAVEVLYVRPRGGAWTYHVADGGGRDADGAQNGRIVMKLQSLVPLRGNGPAPETVAAGDLVLVIDPRTIRAATVEVKP